MKNEFHKISTSLLPLIGKKIEQDLHLMTFINNFFVLSLLTSAYHPKHHFLNVVQLKIDVYIKPFPLNVFRNSYCKTRYY